MPTPPDTLLALATPEWTGPMTLAAGSSPTVLLAIGLIAVLGVGAQWLAWRLRVPSILLLLVSGILAGPVARAVFPGSPLALDPETLIESDLLFALVGISVGLILYEGGLTLRFREIQTVKRTVVSLVTLGAVVTWVIAGAAALVLFTLPLNLAVLLGALLVVTGPTVIGPLLAHIRPSGATGPILRWEGIVIDPIGVLLAVLVFEAIIGSLDASQGGSLRPVVMALGKTIVVGGGLGALAAGIMLQLMSRYWVPDQLQNPVSLMLVVAIFVLSNAIQEESGLLATTVMGMVLANQKRADIRHILEFKESLRVLLIGGLFVLLAARLEFADMREISFGGVIGFLLVLVLVARPASVWISTIGAGLSTNERIFMSLMAPRGIVAAAGASIFAIGLESAGVPDAGKLVPITFSVIIGTVALYGLASGPIARALGVSDQNPQGVVFIGAPAWVREVAGLLSRRGVRVLVVDTNRANIRAARMDNIDAVSANVLDEWVLDELDLRGIGFAFAATPNDEVNTLALQRFAERFDTASLYRLAPVAGKSGKKTAAGAAPPSGSPSTVGPPTKGAKTKARPASGAAPSPASGSGPAGAAKPTEDEALVSTIGRRAFARGADFATLESRVAAGWVVKATNISAEFTYEDFKTLYGSTCTPLLAISEGTVVFSAVDRPLAPAAGDTVVALVNPDELLMLPFTDAG